MRMKAFETRALENKNKPHQNLGNSEQQQIMQQEYLDAKVQIAAN